MPPARIHVTKLAAAKRQLQAAVRLYFLQEDELAIHVIASAAYGLLKDLKKARGASEAADTYRTAYFYLVRDYRRGTLSKEFTSDPTMMVAVQKLAEVLSPITADSKIEDVKVSIATNLEKKYWNETNRIANFLKHADTDQAATVSTDEVDNRLLLLKGVGAYCDVAPDDLGNEGLVFSAFIAASDPPRGEPTSEFDRFVQSIRSVPEANRFRLCYEAIATLNRS